MFFDRLTGGDSDFDKLENSNTAKIVAAESKVKIQVKHDSPALLSEWYPIEINFQNDEDSAILESVLDVKLQTTPEDANFEQTSNFI